MNKPYRLRVRTQSPDLMRGFLAAFECFADHTYEVLAISDGYVVLYSEHPFDYDQIFTLSGHGFSVKEIRPVIGAI